MLALNLAAVSVCVRGIIQGLSSGGCGSVAGRRMRGQTCLRSSLPSSSERARLSLRWSERTQDERQPVGLGEREREGWRKNEIHKVDRLAQGYKINVTETKEKEKRKQHWEESKQSGIFSFHLWSLVKSVKFLLGIQLTNPNFH